MAALPTQFDIQYPQATINAGKSPNAICVYSYGPPAFGNARLNPANTTAKTIAPAAVSSQAHTLFRPYGASEAGSRKMPEPMMLPTTMATHIEKPSCRCSFSIP